MVELSPHLIGTIVVFMLVTIAYGIVKYVYYLRFPERGRDGAERSTLLDGMIFAAMITIVADGSPWGLLAAEVAWVAVAVLAMLRGVDIAASALAKRRTELERRPSR